MSPSGDLSRRLLLSSCSDLPWRVRRRRWGRNYVKNVQLVRRTLSTALGSCLPAFHAPDQPPPRSGKRGREGGVRLVETTTAWRSSFAPLFVTAAESSDHEESTFSVRPPKDEADEYLFYYSIFLGKQRGIKLVVLVKWAFFYFIRDPHFYWLVY